MKSIFYTVMLLVFVASCNLEGVKKEEVTLENEVIIEKQDTILRDIQPVKIDVANDTLVLSNGMKIIYYKKGEGIKLKKGDVVKIAYREKLEDGTIFDGNHIVKKESIPFLVGWNQQTKGWDLGMLELRVGDDVDVFIPSKLGRGEKGIKSIVPPNSNTILSLRVLDKFEPTATIDGVKVWKYDEIAGKTKGIENGDEVSINYFVSSESNPRYDNNYQRGTVYSLTIGDVSLMPGLEKALKVSHEGDRILVMIPSEQAYGKKGLVGHVKPNEDLFYDIQIAHVEKKATE